MNSTERHDELASRVARDRAELRRALDGLRRAAKERTDVHTHMSERPWPFIAAGFMFGYWLGSRASR